jgi:hypothetical protein
MPGPFEPMIAEISTKESISAADENFHLYLLHRYLLHLGTRPYPDMNPPYVPGLELELQFTPFLEGSFSESDVKLRVQIVRIITMTVSRCMEVRIRENDELHLPETGFLKLIDPRFVEDRMEAKAKYPWTPEIENQVDLIDKKIWENIGKKMGFTGEGKYEPGDEDDSWYEAEEKEMEKLEKEDDVGYHRWMAERGFEENAGYAF